MARVTKVYGWRKGAEDTKRTNQSQMEVRELKALLALMRDYDLVELEIEDKKGKVRLVRGTGDPSAERLGEAAGSATRSAAAAARHGGPPKMESGGATDSTAGGVSAGTELAPNQIAVKSPIVGTFYRAPSPDALPFVEEGDAVRKGQPLCIIEAMKMMNEIEAECAGRIVRIVCENAQPVEYGQMLMVLEVA